MWVEQIVGNVGDEIAPESQAIDYIDVDWDRCGRTLKGRTRAGTEVRVLLPLGQKLRHGDVLLDEGGSKVVVNVPPVAVIVACPRDAREAAILSLELGNLHWPTQVSDGEIIFLEDGPPLEVVDRMEIPWSGQLRRFKPTPLTSAPAVKLANGAMVIRREA